MADWIEDTRRVLETRLPKEEASQALMEELDRQGQVTGIGAKTEIDQTVGMALPLDSFWWNGGHGRLQLWLERLQYLIKTPGLPASAVGRAREGIAHLEKLRDQAAAS